MSRLARLLLGGLPLLVACAPTPPPPTAPSAAPPAVLVSASAAVVEAPPPVAPVLATEPTVRSVGTSKVIIPKGWSWTAREDGVVTSPPEGDLRVAFVVSKEADADAAVAKAWAAVLPGKTRKLERVVPRPEWNGFSEKRVYDYETSPNEKIEVYAVALRGPDGWTVHLVEGSESTHQRRGAAIGGLNTSITAKGYQKESFGGKKPLPFDEARKAKLVAFIEEAQRTLQVPGVGLVVIEDGKVVLERGLGVRELGKPAKVDKDTRFPIASNTKGMTTLLLSTLVDEKKLDWETPVAKVYPGFRLGDAATTEKVLVKHLVCACTGLPRQDYEWIFEFAKRKPVDTFGLLATMQPTTQFGEAYQYSNLLASAAGYVAAHVISPGKEVGAAYDDAMQKRLFGPLGMKTATLDVDKAVLGNHASPHGNDVDGKVVTFAMDVNRSVGPVRPAGGAWMSAGDLAKYAILELNKGALPGGKKRIAEEASFLARRAPQVTLPEDAAYGMGLEVDTKWGTPVIQHGGALFGYKSNWMVLPEHGLGIVILTNAGTGGSLHATAFRRFVEIVFDGKAEAEADLKTRVAAIKSGQATERARLTIPPDPALVTKLAAKYGGSALGDLTVITNAKGTTFDFGEWKTAVATRKNEDGTASFVTIDPSVPGADLLIGEKDGKRTLTIRDAQHEYVFVER